MPERAFTPLFKTIAVAVTAGGGQVVPIPGIVSAGAGQVQDVETVLLRVEGSGVAFVAMNSGGAATVIATSGGTGDMSIAAGSESVLGIPAGATQIALNCRTGDAPVVHLTFGVGTEFAGSVGGAAAPDSLVPSGSPFSATSAAVLFTQATGGYQQMACAVTSIGSGNTIIFEESTDNSNWYPVNGFIPNDTDPNAGSGNTLSSTGLFICNCHGAYIRARVSAYGSGTVMVAPVLRTRPVAETGLFAPGQAGALLMSSDGFKATYGIAGTVALSTSSWTDIVELLGSSSKTVRVKHIECRFGLGTAGLTPTLSLVRRSSASSGGTSSNPTPGKFDSNDPAATATVVAWTAPATANGAAVATLGSKVTTFYSSDGTSQSPPVVWDFATREDKALILRGTSDVLGVSLGGTAANSASLSYEIWWEEDNS